MRNKVMGPLFFEEPMVTGDTFLAVIGNSALHQVPVGTVFQLYGALPHFSHCAHAFQDKFLDCWIGKEETLHCPLILQI